jgi:hypothetical protein
MNVKPLRHPQLDREAKIYLEDLKNPRRLHRWIDALSQLGACIQLNSTQSYFIHTFQINHIKEEKTHWFILFSADGSGGGGARAVGVVHNID